MVNRNLLTEYDLPEDQLQQELADVFAEAGTDVSTTKWLPDETQVFEANKIVTGRVMQVVGDDVVIDVGYKSEGIIAVAEWYDEGQDKVVPPQPGDEVQVLLEAVEDQTGAIVLCCKKAKRQQEW